MVISNCAITKQTSKILESATMNSSHDVHTQYHTGVDLEGSKIYTMYDGTVVVSKLGHIGHSVIIQTGMSFCIVYEHLESANVQVGQYVAQGDLIGYADNWVHVELLKLKLSAWPVRIGETTWYKADPQELFTTRFMSANVQQFSELHITETSTYPSGKPNDVEGYCKFILSNNRGD